MTDVVEVAREVLRQSGIPCLSIESAIHHNDPPPAAPRREHDLRLVTLGWAPTFHPVRIPILIKAILDSRGRVEKHDLSPLQKMVKGQRARHRRAVEAFGDNHARPLPRTLDVPIDQARPDVGLIQAPNALLRHLAATTGSWDGARRHLEIGVETILRRREAGRTEIHPTISLQEHSYDEDFDLGDGMRMHYHMISMDEESIPDVYEAKGRSLGTYVEIEGLSSFPISVIHRHRDRISVFLRTPGQVRTTIDELVDADRLHIPVPRIAKALERPAQANAAIPFGPDWTIPDRILSEGISKGGIASIEEIAGLDDVELAVRTGLTDEGVRRLRSYAASRLNELLEMNAGRLVRRACIEACPPDQ